MTSSPLEPDRRERSRYRVMVAIAVVATVLLVVGLALVLAGNPLLGGLLALIGVVDLALLPVLGNRLRRGSG